MTAKLERATFETSRELEYFSEKELCAQIGHDTARVKAMLNEDSRLSWDGAIWKLAETVEQSNEH